jgi:hypothetical protein
MFLGLMVLLVYVSSNHAFIPSSLRTSRTLTWDRDPKIHRLTESALVIRGGSITMSLNIVGLAETVAPTVGIFTSTALYVAPAMSVMKAIKDDSIGDLNPVCIVLRSSTLWFHS